MHFVPLFRRASRQLRETMFWGLVFITGACGTTFLSPMINDFVFTWPVCLFAVFQSFVDRVALRHKQLSSRERVSSGIAGAVFITTCLFYFLVCRRLSLVFEWVFLSGFFAATPLSLAARHLFQNRRWSLIWKILLTASAFAAFYWSSVGFLHLRVT
jgi:hypothetical protein